MLLKALSSLHRALLLIALTVALAGTGFAHRMSTVDDEALAFSLANGVSLADLCAGGGDGDGPRDPHCMACQIAGTAALPPATPGLIDLELGFVAQVVAPRESRAIAAVLDPSHAPQAPPAA